MSDDDLIRRGDALRVADEVFDQCENVNGDDRGAFAAAEVGARIAALPAVTVGVRPLVEAVEALNAACDAMWNDHERLERNPDRWGQKMRIKERHLKAITEAQQRLPAILAALDLTPAPDAQAIREAAQGLAAFLDAKHQSYVAAKGRNPADYVSGYSIARDKANAILALLTPKGGA